MGTLRFKALKKRIDTMKFETIGFNKENHSVGLIEQKGLMSYFDRRPLYFRDCQSVGKGIYFANYFAWMGKIRESAMFPILSNISDDFNTGKIGMVTNRTTLKILGDATVGDIIETRFGLLNRVSDSTLEIFFVWKKLLPDQSYEELAYAEMSINWVEILSHGFVKSSPFPEYYNDFIETIADDEMLPFNYEIEAHDFSRLEKGAQLYSAPNSPRRGKLVAEEQIVTTLEDGNSVGNIYFSNYGRWQGVVRDGYFHGIERAFFENIGQEGELVVLECEVNHLREAMPFSQILVTMNVVEVWENAASLSFAYFNIDNGEKIKLASSSQLVVWAKKNEEKVFESMPFPSIYRDALLS